MPAWRGAGKEIVATATLVRGNIGRGIPQVIIDLRQRDEAVKGHLPGAVSLPAKEIAGAKDRFPAHKRATIILYAADDKTASEAFKVIRGWGYVNTVVLKGGIDAWIKGGNPIATAALRADMVYVPRPRPGSISIGDFNRIIETRHADVLILDVRDTAEAANGMISGAVNIPVQDIPHRLAELPKDRLIVVHCVAGVRAEMAHLTLRDAGFRSRFLHANIKIDQDGKYEITEP
jgi:rhodanese-related sulfurtransferase